jgi:hypothetical protein
MKHFFLLVLTVLIMTVSISCSDEGSPLNILSSNLDSDSMIAEAEKKLGTLYKEEREFIDQNSGSRFTVMFAAVNRDQLSDFFLNNNIEVRGVTEETRKNLLNSRNKLNPSEPINPIVNNSSEVDFTFDEVYYDVINKKFRGNDIGLSFTIKPKDFESNSNARTAANSWRQQTSLPWCEWATLYAITESFPQSYYVYTQSRGLFWNGSGLPVGILRTDGSIYDIAIDGPKFTRFGGPDPVASKFYVTWYDLESGSTVTN